MLDYLTRSLSNHYEPVRELRHTEVSRITLYRHLQKDHRLVVIRSRNSNDSVYEKLVGTEHPNLVKIYDFISLPDELIILEEYIEGISLREKIGVHGIDKKTVKRYMSSLCNAVDFLHFRNIIHRDIKPENIILCGDTLKLIDFNIARVFNDKKDRDTMKFGTVQYASPEQFGLMQTYQASDIYSMGVLMNEMLTGVHPTIKNASGRLGRIVRRSTRLQADQRYKNVIAFKKAICGGINRCLRLR